VERYEAVGAVDAAGGVDDVEADLGAGGMGEEEDEESPPWTTWT
jgi:hypothetical protein